jgi:hypothetical protein
VLDSSSVRAVLKGQKPIPIRPIVANRGASTTSSRMRRAFPWPRHSRGLTLMT